MSKNTREFIEQLKQPESMGTIEAMTAGLTQGVKAFLDGAGKVWDEAQPMFDHGRTEAAAAWSSRLKTATYLSADPGTSAAHAT